MIHSCRLKTRVLKVSGKSSAYPALLSGSIDTNEDKISLLDAFIDIGGEKEVTSAGLADNIIEAWFVNRQLKVRAIPGIHTGLVKVNNGYSDVGAF